MFGVGYVPSIMDEKELPCSDDHRFKRWERDLSGYSGARGRVRRLNDFLNKQQLLEPTF